MPQERKAFDKKIFKLGALAAGPLIFAACAAEKQQSAPPAPPQYIDNPVNQSDQEPPTLQTSEPTPQPTETEAPKKTSTRMPTATVPSEYPTPEIISGGYLDGHLRFNEKGYRYTMYPEMSLARLLGQTETGESNNWDVLQFLKESAYIKPQAADDIRKLLTTAKQEELANPKDPEIIKNVNSAANILNENCNDTFLKGYMKSVASFVYHKNPQAWPTNRKLFIEGNCFWGEKSAR